MAQQAATAITTTVRTDPVSQAHIRYRRHRVVTEGSADTVRSPSRARLPCLPAVSHASLGVALAGGACMLAAVRSATFLGVEGRPVTVEVHVSSGLPGFQIVGLPDEACRESRDRVRAAVLSSGLPWPSCRTTVNLAPSSQRKKAGRVSTSQSLSGCWRRTARSRRRRWPSSAFSASWASTDRCEPSPGWPPWSPPSAISSRWCPAHRSARLGRSRKGRCGLPLTCARSSTP